MSAGRKYDSGNAYWDEVAGNVDRYYLIPPLAEYKNREYIGLLERWGIGPGKRILVTDLYEAAYGNIGIYRYLSGKAEELLLMDISPRLCLKAKENLEKRGIAAGIISGDALTIPLSSGSQDAVISPSTFDHFPQIEQALKECYRILRPGGKLVLALNSADNPFFKIGVRLAERFKKHEYQTDYFYSAREAVVLLGRAGFSVGRSTAIMHVPIGLTTLLEILEGLNNPVAGRINGMMIGACRKWGRLDTRMKLFTGWWIVSEGIKQ